MLHFKLTIGVISELAESETLVGSLRVNLLAQLILLIIQGLQNVLLSVRSGLALLVKLILEVGQVVSGFEDELI